jgi:hypothetical protein
VKTTIAEEMMSIADLADFLDHIAGDFEKHMSEQQLKVAENLWQRVLPVLEESDGLNQQVAVLSRLTARRMQVKQRGPIWFRQSIQNRTVGLAHLDFCLRCFRCHLSSVFRTRAGSVCICVCGHKGLGKIANRRV